VRRATRRRDGRIGRQLLGGIGLLHALMFRAVRLVVDTGLHRKRRKWEQVECCFAETFGNPRTARDIMTRA
jgi:uncharacterized protein (DUF885 family)